MFLLSGLPFTDSSKGKLRWNRLEITHSKTSNRLSYWDEHTQQKDRTKKTDRAFLKIFRLLRITPKREDGLAGSRIPDLTSINKKAGVLAVARSMDLKGGIYSRVIINNVHWRCSLRSIQGNSLWLLADGWIKGQIFCRNVRWSTFFLVAFSSCSLTIEQMLADYRVRMKLYDCISYRCWCVCDLMLFQWTRYKGALR